MRNLSHLLIHSLTPLPHSLTPSHLLIHSLNIVFSQLLSNKFHEYLTLYENNHCLQTYNFVKELNIFQICEGVLTLWRHNDVIHLMECLHLFWYHWKESALYLHFHGSKHKSVRHLVQKSQGVAQNPVQHKGTVVCKHTIAQSCNTHPPSYNKVYKTQEIKLKLYNRGANYMYIYLQLYCERDSSDSQHALNSIL